MICVVSEDFGQQAVNCEESHKPGDMLWERQGFHAEKSKKVKVPRLKEARAVLECEVKQFVELGGDHVILVGRVLHAQAEDGGLDAIRPLLHDSGERFRDIGKEVILKRRR